MTFGSYAAEHYPYGTVTVYGSFDIGKYADVIRAFEKEGYTVINMWGRHIDFIGELVAPVLTSEKTTITLMTRNRHPEGIFKDWLNAIVSENFDRSSQGRPLIPIVFCIGNEKVGQTVSAQLTPRQVVSRDDEAEGSITAQEIRRAYKLCRHPIWKDVANRTFRFVITQLSDNEVVALKDIAHPWDHSEWEGLWAIRMASKAASPKKSSTSTTMEWK